MFNIFVVPIIIIFGLIEYFTKKNLTDEENTNILWDCEEEEISK